MCTVAFIPYNNRFYFASLRDENPGRERASVPVYRQSNGITFLAPVDPLGGGTWVGVNETGNLVVLLNGGFENHSKNTAYAKSRGLIVVDMLGSYQPINEWDLMNLENIEPFTLIVWAEENLFRLVWDGQQKHKISLALDTAHIWSSATLYDTAARARREELFKEWVAEKEAVSKSSLIGFLKTHNDPENGFFINREERFKTLSYTFIEMVPGNTAEISYYDLSSGKDTSAAINFVHSNVNSF